MGGCCTALDLSNEDPYIVDNGPGINELPRRGSQTASPFVMVPSDSYSSGYSHHSQRDVIRNDRDVYGIEGRYVSSSPELYSIYAPEGVNRYQENMYYPPISWECTVPGPVGRKIPGNGQSNIQDFVIPYCTPRMMSPIPSYRNTLAGQVRAPNSGFISPVPFTVPAPSPVPPVEIPVPTTQAFEVQGSSRGSEVTSNAKPFRYTISPAPSPQPPPSPINTADEVAQKVDNKSISTSPQPNFAGSKTAYEHKRSSVMRSSPPPTIPRCVRKPTLPREGSASKDLYVSLTKSNDLKLNAIRLPERMTKNP